MDTGYRRRLLMLQGAQGQTGFSNIEQSGPKVTVKIQAVGLDRAACDIHGYLVSYGKRRKLDCGRIRVDSRGQGGLLREWRDEAEMEESYISDYDAIAITGGGEVLLAGNLNSGETNWEAIRAVLRPELYHRIDRADRFDRFDRFDKVDSVSSKSQEITAKDSENQVNSMIEMMQPNTDPHPDTPITIVETIPEVVLSIDKMSHPVKPGPQPEALSKPLSDLFNMLTQVPEDKIRAMTDALKVAQNASAPRQESYFDEPMFHHIAAEPVIATPVSPTYETIKTPERSPRLVVDIPIVDSDAEGLWPVWSAYGKPAWDWPSEASDLREIFECGTPCDDVAMPEWTFVRAPCAISGEESLLGVMVRDGRVVRTACLFRGEEAPEPPAGLSGYVFERNLGTGYWVRWRSYVRQPV